MILAVRGAICSASEYSFTAYMMALRPLCVKDGAFAKSLHFVSLLGNCIKTQLFPMWC